MAPRRASCSAPSTPRQTYCRWSRWAAAALRRTTHASPKPPCAASGPPTGNAWDSSAGMDIAAQLKVQDLLVRYAEAIDDDKLEVWPGFFVEQCRYVITTADN